MGGSAEPVQKRGYLVGAGQTQKKMMNARDTASLVAAGKAVQTESLN